jgi:phospholipase C
VRNIGDALLEKNISFAYFGDQFNAYLQDKYQLNYGAIGKPAISTATSATSSNTQPRS